MLQIHSIGYQFVNIGGFDVNRPEGTGDYLLVFFRCDTEVYSEGKYETVPENSFLFFRKGSPQVYRKTDGHFINDWIHLDSDAEGFLESLGIPMDRPFTVEGSREITDMISDLFIEYFHVGQSHDRIMDQKAQALLYRLSDLVHLSQNNSRTRLDYFTKLHDLRESLLRYEYRPANVTEIADQYHISVSYLQHMYKEFFGCSLKEELIRGRIEYAAHLLSGGQHSVSEVAELCGYENLEHFSRQFKKWKGTSPSHYTGSQVTSQKPSPQVKSAKIKR